MAAKLRDKPVTTAFPLTERDAKNLIKWLYDHINCDGFPYDEFGDVNDMLVRLRGAEQRLRERKNRERAQNAEQNRRDAEFARKSKDIP